MKLPCPKCGHELISVSALTHGCYPCQRAFIMRNGRLLDLGHWSIPARVKKQKKRDLGA